jgi:hypothetical protein
MAEDNNRFRASPWSTSPVLMTVVVTIGLAVLGAFWQLSDPRFEIRDIKSNYLTIREHQEFQARLDRDIKRLETMEADQNANFVTKREMDNLMKMQEQQNADIRTALAALANALHQHEHDDFLMKNGIGK